MKSTNYFAGVAVLVMISLGALDFQRTPAGGARTLALAQAASAQSPEATKLHAVKTYGKLPLSFEANQGQTDAPVKFVSRGRGYTLFLTPTEAVLSLRGSVPSGDRDNDTLRGMSKPVLLERLTSRSSPLPNAKSTVLHMQLVGANPAPHLSGLEELPGKSNYFIGNDPKQWRTNMPTYAKVCYREVYPGVDLAYYGNERQLEHDFIVAPGADPRVITLGFHGADKLVLDPRGDLVLHIGEGEIRLLKPSVYQEVDGAKRYIPGGYELKGTHQVGFAVGAYDKTKPVVIDPVLAYSTYLGGSGDDVGRGIAVDSYGNAYVTGYTYSANFPTASAFQSNCSRYADGTCTTDVFVAKLNPAGNGLVYSTYLGGSGSDGGSAIAVDTSGNAYVTGLTTSTNFPTANPFQAAYGGGYYDAFVTKLNPAGNGLVYSTYLGGSGSDQGFAIAVDASAQAYVTGFTGPGNFPTVSPLQASNAGFADVFVTKFNAWGTALVYSTYLGGNGPDVGTGIAVDPFGNAYVAGWTISTNFPTANPFQASCRPAANGTCSLDAFVAKLNAAGSALVYSTYLGGSSTDEIFSIAVDSFGQAYVTGRTSSTDFPTAGPIQATNAGGLDAFVAKLNAAGNALVYSTYLGGSNNDEGFGIALDSSGNAHVTGRTVSSNFPVKSPLQGRYSGYQDAFVAKLNAAGSALVYSTYLGGSGSDGGSAIAVDTSGNAYVAGSTDSTNFPTASPIQSANGGGTDVFVAKISPASPTGRR